MSKEITRFNHVTDWGMERDAHGDYVLHSDHEAIVDSMAAALVKLDGACLASEQEVGRLRAELEWLHSWLPPMQVLVSAVEEQFCSELTEASEQDHSKVSYPEEDCPITFGMIRDARKAIDYAMGEGK